MSCCGKKRSALNESLSQTEPAFSRPQTGSQSEDTVFEYTGSTGLTVKGNITGMTYRFNRTGDRQLIDHRDAAGMMALSMLRKVDKK